MILETNSQVADHEELISLPVASLRGLKDQQKKVNWMVMSHEYLTRKLEVDWMTMTISLPKFQLILWESSNNILICTYY